MTAAEDASVQRRRLPGREWWTWFGIGTGVWVTAFLVRLLPVLRGSGLRSAYGYDPAVYYAAATGMANGLMPYRDFLLLHPPGVPVALLPFALVAQHTSDSTGMALARLAVMAMGATTALIIVRILRQVGPVAALVGGLGYAVYWPAAYSERAVWLEGFGSFLLAVAMLLVLGVPRLRERLPRLTMALAGAGLGLSVATKIWMVVPALALLACLLVRRQWRDALFVSIGAAIAGLILVAPFIGVLPQMWDMVVNAQFGRERGITDTIWMRLDSLAGLDYIWRGEFHSAAAWVLAIGGTISLLAVKRVEGRLALLLTAASLVLLLSGPTWFRHYPALVAPSLAVALGAGAQVLVDWIRPRWARIVASVLLVGVLLGTGGLLGADTVGKPFAGRKLARLAKTYPGCVTTDDPNTLIAANLLTAGIANGCRFVVDLSGYRYVIGDRTTFLENEAWQQYVRDYLGSGSLTLLFRSQTKPRLNAESRAELKSWPVVDVINGHAVRAPQ